jgi:uncharacterized protein (TIGR03435 family)
VASIRPSVVGREGGEGSLSSRVEYTTDSLTMRNISLSECLQWAYGVQYFQISGPKSLHTERYDILAKTTDPVTVKELRGMLQNLLASRFKLLFHRDIQQLPIYELVVARHGAKLPSAKVDSELSPPHVVESVPRVVAGSFVFQETSMKEFAEKLSDLRGIDRPVMDKTGIEGYYDITLKSGASAILDPNGPSLFTLMEEQLGLKLMPVKGPIEVLVVDHVEKPAGN